MNNLFLLLLLLIIPLGIFFFFRSRKKKKEQGEKIVYGKQRKLESEAWVTVKKYLRDNNETGKEILELFVVKKPDETDKNGYATKELKQKQKQKIKEQKQKDKLEKKQNPEEYKKRKKAERMEKRRPENWFLYFITRNAKTKEIDEPRIIEAIITYKRINKKQSDRVITVNADIDFNKEWEWIKPVKEKEDKQKQKMQENIERKKQKKAQKLAQKEKSKNQKNNNEKQ